MLRVGWFSTGRGEGSLGLFRFVQERILAGRLDARIEFVFSNREPGEAEGSDRFLQAVQEYGIPQITLSSARFRRERGGGPASRHREAYHQRALDLLEGQRPDICVLAGYMLIASGAMCRRYPLLNLHPALPDGPTGTWQEVIWTLIRERAEYTGAMMHLATEEVDRGPVVSHFTVPITGGEFDTHWRELAGVDLDEVGGNIGEDFPLFQLIRQAEYRREPYLLLETLRAVAGGRVVIRDGDALDPSGVPLARAMPRGLCLDREIDQAMEEEATG